MRNDEIYAMKVLADHFKGDFEDGENPPDGYLSYNNRKVAVEISRITQSVTDLNGTIRPRLSDDQAAINLCKEIEKELQNDFPENRYVWIEITTPIYKVRRIKKELKEKIRELISKGTGYFILKSYGNCIKCRYRESDDYKKNLQYDISNKNSSDDLHQNANDILKERLENKAKKFNENKNCPVWLVLIDDYLCKFDERELYKQIYKEIDIKHPFEKIFIISDGILDELYSAR